MEVCMETQKRGPEAQTGVKAEGWEEAVSGKPSGVLDVNLSLGEDEHELVR